MDDRIDYFERMLADNPDNPTGLLALANEYEKAGRDEDEAAVLERYLAVAWESGATPVVLSVLGEALLLSLIGGVLGGLLAWAAFDGYQTATMNWQSFSQVAFSFAVTPELLVRGLIYAALMGLLGGLLPAIRAARLPVVTALRQL